MNFRDLPFGKSNLGEEIQAFISEDKAPKYIYLMAGVHGDEVEGIYVLKNLFEWLKNNEKIKIPLLIIPLLNVDGYRANSRVNAKGVDLNRNLPSKHWTAEAREENIIQAPLPFLSQKTNSWLNYLKNIHPNLSLAFIPGNPCLTIMENAKRSPNFYPNITATRQWEKLRITPPQAPLVNMGQRSLSPRF
ncbi:MAG: succinylglutamate desuccinylase/aspartoacylase family protein [Bacteriovoracales bacterium]